MLKRDAVEKAALCLHWLLRLLAFVFVERPNKNNVIRPPVRMCSMDHTAKQSQKVPQQLPRTVLVEKLGLAKKPAGSAFLFIQKRLFQKIPGPLL